MNRDLKQYKSTNANASDIALPCMFLQQQFGFELSKITIRIENEPRIDVGEFPTGFPQTITSYLWTHKGSPGNSPWFALGQLDSGAWFYFFAKCPECARPFADPGACIYLYAAWNYENLVLHAMDQEGYETYIRESRDQTDANTQMSHQASDASGLSEVAGLPAPFGQFHGHSLHARELEYRGLLLGSAGSSEIQESSSAHTGADTEQSDASRPADRLDS